MGQPVIAGGWRGWKAAMLLENRNASLDALVTDIYGWTGDKSPDLIGRLARDPSDRTIPVSLASWLMSPYP
jgi:hypothetical protein